MEFSTEFWANHKKGIEKRAEISNYLSKNPTASVELIAVAVNLSTRQVHSHRVNVPNLFTRADWKLVKIALKKLSQKSFQVKKYPCRTP